MKLKYTLGALAVVSSLTGCSRGIVARQLQHAEI